MGKEQKALVRVGRHFIERVAGTLCESHHKGACWSIAASAESITWRGAPMTPREIDALVAEKVMGWKPITVTNEYGMTRPGFLP